MTHTTGWDAAVGVDWSKLCHAYGAAHDTPAHLRALTDGDADAVRRALKHLCSAVVHQGTPWPVTAPAARVVAGLLAEESLSRPAAAPVGAAGDAGDAGAPLRSALLSFLAGVAEAGCPHLDDAELRAAAFPADVAPERVDAAPEAVLDGDATAWPGESGAVEALTARAVLDLRAAAPVLLDAVVPHLADGEPLTRMHAAHAAAALAVLVGDAARREDLADRVAAAARRAVRRDERACLVLALGDLGRAPRAFLADPDPAVRACAALAPALAGDPDAVGELLAALADPAAADAWFTHRPPQFPHHVRFTLVRAAVERVDDFARLLPAACAVAAVAGPFTADFDWGPLLCAAFPTPLSGAAVGADLTDAQRAYLRALVANESLWRGRVGNAALALRRVGLPEDRESCRRLAAS